MFANRDAGLINGACFETDDDGDDVLVIPEDVFFRHDTNPHPMQGGAGQVNPAIALATLARNKWIAVERGDGRFRIRRGVRANGSRRDANGRLRVVDFIVAHRFSHRHKRRRTLMSTVKSTEATSERTRHPGEQP